MKTLWPTGKLLIMINFTFGHNVFKSRRLLLRQNASESGKGLFLRRHAKWRFCFMSEQWRFGEPVNSHTLVTPKT